MPFNEWLEKPFLQRLVMFFINASHIFGTEGGYRWERITDDATQCIGESDKILCPSQKVANVNICFKNGKANSQDGVFAGMGHGCYIRGSNKGKTDETLAVLPCRCQ